METDSETLLFGYVGFDSDDLCCADTDLDVGYEMEGLLGVFFDAHFHGRKAGTGAGSGNLVCAGANLDIVCEVEGLEAVSLDEGFGDQ